MYHVLLFLHILAAIVWIGGTTAMQVMVLRAELSRDGARLARMSGESEWMGTRVLLPVSLVLLAAGVSMAMVGKYGFGQPFTIVGLLGFACSVVIGTLLGVWGKAMKAAITERGQEDGEARRMMRRIFLMSRIELVILLVVVFCMVFKPGTTT